ncbi:hypothetical protein [Nitrosopumilus sp. S4]
MTIKKAIKILDWFIELQKNRSEGFADPQKLWNQNHDFMRDFAKSLSDSIQNEVEILQILRKELVPNCKHPKKMQDMDSNGNRYCMNCNMDL